MKKFQFIAALFLVPFCGVSQTRKSIDAFLGIKFGTDSNTFKSSISAKGARFIVNASHPGNWVFDNITIGDRKGFMLFANFVNNKFYEADLVCPNDPGPQCIPYYNELVKDLNKTYGMGEDHKTFISPYHEGDGKELAAIQSKNAQYLYFWYDEAGNKMAVTIDVSLKVMAILQDLELSKLAQHN